MTYTEEELKTIEKLASLYMKPSEIALVLNKPTLAFREDISFVDSPAYIAYNRGKIAQKLEVRKQMATLARVGSPLALEQSERALLDMEDDEL